MKTDYELEDLSFEKLPPRSGGVCGVTYPEPEGEDSY
tara:strand:- start:234 stop:344 length:111 start_codon:yes stop_codon:yes gene_type:complete